jgi:hypothetical protein
MKYKYIRLENIENFVGWNLGQVIPEIDANHCTMCVIGFDDTPQKDVEIEQLKAENERLQKYNTDVAYKHYNDGIKEFAERLKESMSTIARMEFGGNVYFCVGYGVIDNLVKEMVGDTDA